MPFRLSNTLTNFQRYINKILAKKLNNFIIDYLGGILIYCEDPGKLYVRIVY